MLAKMSNCKDTKATYTATVEEANIDVSLLEKLTLTLACWRSLNCNEDADVDVSLLEKLKSMLACQRS